MTDFPTSLDNLTNPSGGDNLDSPNHADQHADANDAIEAIQVKVGIDGSADTNSHDYKLANALTIEDIYPIGAIYIETTGTNPNTTFGFGTWVAFGDGRVPVGYDSGDIDFDTAEETGGAKTHTLTESEMPAHLHTVDPPATASGNQSASHKHLVSRYENTYAAGSTPNWRSISSDNSPSHDYTETNNTGNQLTSHTHTTNIPEFNSGSTGGGTAHTIVQPYIVVHMWKRTA